MNLILYDCLDENKLTGPLPDFPSGSNLEVISAGRFFVGCIFVFQRDVYLCNLTLVNAGCNTISSTIPTSIYNLRNTRILNFGK